MSKKRNFYEISIDHELHFINFKCRLTCPVDGIVKISLWRPGRYEFGDFAKNIRNFCAYDENDLELKVHKHSRNSYRIFGASRTEIIICYQYYAHELNAGSSFSDGTYLYINPINCFVYSDESKELPHQVNLQVPENWTIAGVPGNTACFELPNFDRMVDTPFIASPNLNITKFEVNNISFRIVIQGYYDVIQEKVISDFKKFCKRQLADFTYFPSKQYEFLVISPDYFIYHGVEHLNSTVITLGPNKKLFDELYTEFLGVSSHELYHVWNVKSFRPKEMTPYLFDTENYSRFGFIYEGVTTYLGDLYLLKSGVFDITQYFKELEAQFDKHGRNDGRFNYSLGDSSIDTWIDGYTPGIPDRKVSIYTEGCLFALLLDIEIISGSII